MLLGNELIEGALVKLTSLTKTDFDTFSIFIHPATLLTWLHTESPFPLTLKEWFDQQQASEHTFALRLRVDNQLIGTCLLKNMMWQARHAEVNITVLDPQNWHKGYGTDAMQTLLRYAFMDMNLNRLYAFVPANHARAYALCEKVGFTEESRLRQTIYRDGEYLDTFLMGILRREWEVQ